MTRIRLNVTDHAIDRWRLHHPGQGACAIIRAVDKGLSLAPAEALQLIARKWALKNAVYVLVKDDRGMFVIAPPSPKAIADMATTGRSAKRTVVTYLRFSARQVAEVAKYAPRKELSASVRLTYMTLTPEERAARAAFEAHVARPPGVLKPSKLRQRERRAAARAIEEAGPHE